MKALGWAALGLSLTAAASLLTLAGAHQSTNAHRAGALNYLSPDSRKADALAVTAGDVMQRGLGPGLARGIAWAVGAKLPDRSIETLQADGRKSAQAYHSAITTAT